MKTFKMVIRGKRCVKIIRSGGHNILLLLKTQDRHFVKKSSDPTVPSWYAIVTGSVKVVWSGEVDPWLTIGADKAWFCLIN